MSGDTSSMISDCGNRSTLLAEEGLSDRFRSTEPRWELRERGRLALTWLRAASMLAVASFRGEPLEMGTDLRLSRGDYSDSTFSLASEA